MSVSSSSSMSEEQKQQYRRVVEDAVAKACDLTLQQVALDEDGLQRLISHCDELDAAVARAIIIEARALSTSDKLDHEEVESNFGYFSHYEPKAIAMQTNRLRELIPGVDAADEKVAERPLPDGAEGFFAIPRWEAIAPTYGEALEKMLALIDRTRNGRFCNYRGGKLGAQYLREYEPDAAMWKQIGEAQKGYGILVVPAQFGLRHRGRSVRRAREVMRANEFGLGAFTIAAMLLTHPERMKEYDDLWIDCAGDEYAPDGNDQFTETPFFFFNNGELEFDVIGYERDRFGSASGFLL